MPPLSNLIVIEVKYVQGGFTFCGLDIADIGLEYAPELSNTYVYKTAPKSIQEQRVESHEGGYYYGVTTDVKDFILRCYFEKNNVRNGIMSKINYYFKIGKTGKLVFNKRQWCWYTATVIDVDTNNLLNYENGIVVIKLRAYYPYARSDIYTIPIDSQESVDMINNSALFTNEDAMPITEFGSASDRITSQTSIILFNPGTQRAKVAIEIAGNVGEGVTITNSTTNQSCKFVAISDALTTNVNKYVVSDALNGKTVLTNGTISGTMLAFLYHDNGFLELEPAYPMLRNIHVSYVEDSSEIITEEDIIDNVVGKFIYIDNEWRKIVAQPSINSLTIATKPENTGTTITEIALMNEITIIPNSTMSLSKLNFVYCPTYS